MTRRRYAAVAVAALVVLAGCNAFGSAGESAPETADDVTPVDVDPPMSTATRTADRAPDSSSFAGIETDGTVDPAGLLDSHLAYLGNRSFTLTWSKQTVGGSGPVAASYDRRAAVVNGTTYLERSNGTMYLGPETTYADPDGQYRRVELANGSVLSGEIDTGRDRPREWFASIPAAVFTVFLIPAATDVNVVEVDGRHYARLFSQTVPEYVQSVYSDYTVENYTATLWVAPEGFVTSIHYSYELHRPGDRVYSELRYVYSDVGETSVDQPEWVTEIEREQTAPTATPASGTESANHTDSTVATP